MLKRHTFVKCTKEIIDLCQKDAARTVGTTYIIHERSSNPYGFTPLAAEYTFGSYNLRLYQVVADADNATFAVVFSDHEDETVFTATHILLISEYKIDLGALPFCFSHMESHQRPKCPKTQATIFYVRPNKFIETLSKHVGTRMRRL